MLAAQCAARNLEKLPRATIDDILLCWWEPFRTECKPNGSILMVASQRPEVVPRRIMQVLCGCWWQLVTFPFPDTQRGVILVAMDGNFAASGAISVSPPQSTLLPASESHITVDANGLF